jgi:hypothetical protein
MYANVGDVPRAVAATRRTTGTALRQRHAYVRSCHDTPGNHQALPL